MPLALDIIRPLGASRVSFARRRVMAPPFVLEALALLTARWIWVKFVGVVVDPPNACGASKHSAKTTPELFLLLVMVT